MSKNLEEVIRELAARGEISHISLVPSQKGEKWRGSFAMCSKFGISFAEDADPVVALTMAMTTAKMKPARALVRDQDLVPTIPQETIEVEDATGQPLAAYTPDATGQHLEDPAADLM